MQSTRYLNMDGKPWYNRVRLMQLQETMNFWKQSNHIMSYFKEENFRGEQRLPSNFMSGFLEVRSHVPALSQIVSVLTISLLRVATEKGYQRGPPVDTK